MTNIEVLHKQAVYTIYLKLFPTPTMEAAKEYGDGPSLHYPDLPRWHDFVAPELREALHNGTLT